MIPNLKCNHVSLPDKVLAAASPRHYRKGGTVLRIILLLVVFALITCVTAPKLSVQSADAMDKQPVEQQHVTEMRKAESA